MMTLMLQYCNKTKAYKLLYSSIVVKKLKVPFYTLPLLSILQPTQFILQFYIEQLALWQVIC